MFDWARVDNYNVGTSALLPEGKHEVKIINAEERVSMKGHDCINLTLQCVDEDKMQYKVYDGIYWHSDSTTKRAKYIFIEIGLEAVLNEKRFPNSRELCSVNSFIVDIEHEEYNGNSKAKVNFFGYHRINAKDIKVPANIASGTESWTDEPDMGEPPF